LALTSFPIRFPAGADASMPIDVTGLRVLGALIGDDAPFFELWPAVSHNGTDWYDVWSGSARMRIWCAEPGFYPFGLAAMHLRFYPIDGNGQPATIDADCVIRLLCEPRK